MPRAALWATWWPMWPGRFPELAPRLRDADGRPYAFVTFYLNDEDIRFVGGFDAVVADGDEITIVPAIAGG